MGGEVHVALAKLNACQLRTAARLGVIWFELVRGHYLLNLAAFTYQSVGVGA